jgi:hypothetical protein
MVNFIDYFVDGTNGSDTYNGRSWGRAKATINAALALCSGRALNRVWVAPGGYNEDVLIPLNATAPFGQLLAWNPTPNKSFGGTYIYGSTSGGNSIEVRARGWLIDGFEIGVTGAGKCVVVGGATAGNNGGGLTIQNCIISGWGTGVAGIDFQSNIASNAHVSILGNFFDGFNNGGNTAACMICSASGIDQPRYAWVEANVFADSDNLISMNPRGFKESWILRNTFHAIGANYTPTLKLDNRGGNATIIGGNYLGGTYSEAGGYYGNAGGNDEWGGNYNSLAGGVTAADPA